MDLNESLTPEQIKREKNKIKSKKYYYRNREVQNAKRVERARKSREATNARARERYKNDPEERLKQQSRRIKREPYRVLRACERDLAKGILSGSECIDRINQALTWADERIANASRKSGI